MKFLVLAVLLAALPASAAQVTLAFDASSTPGITNYVVYAHPVGLGGLNYTNRLASLVRVSIGTNLVAIIQNITTNQLAFAVTAQKDGMESDFSNIILLSVPIAPTALRVGP